MTQIEELARAKHGSYEAGDKLQSARAKELEARRARLKAEEALTTAARLYGDQRSDFIRAVLAEGVASVEQIRVRSAGLLDGVDVLVGLGQLKEKGIVHEIRGGSCAKWGMAIFARDLLTDAA